MNFLELCQTTLSIARSGQGELGAEPETVIQQSGKLGEIVRFVRLAWQDIQHSNPHWRFMKRESTLLLPQGQNVADPAAIDDYDGLSLAQAPLDRRFITFTSVSNPGTEQIIRFVPYPDFQQSFLDRAPRAEGTPSMFTITPGGRLRFDAIAIEPITLRLVIRRAAQALAEDADIPIMPARHHMAIVWWAIVNYYCTTRDDADKLRVRAEVQLQREMRLLRHEQLEEVLGVEGVL